MYCPNCGKELPEGGRFCPSCGASSAPGQRGTPPPPKPAPTVTLNSRTLLILAAAVIVALLLVVIFRPGQGKDPDTPLAPGQTSQAQPTPEPDPAAALVGTWTNKDGVGLKFTSDGTLKLSGLGLTLNSDTFTYEVTGENTLTLTASVGGILSADMEAPYGIVGDTLYIEIADYSLELTKK